MNYEQPDLMWFYRVSKYGIYVSVTPDEESEKQIKKIAKKLKIKDYDNYHVTLAHSKVGDTSSIPYSFDYSAECVEFDLFGENEDTLVIRLKSEDLETRHANLRNKGYIYDFNEYRPHVTICENWDKELPDSSILYNKEEPITLTFGNESGEPLSEL